jgi:flagellar biogenesis protein FliO
VSTALGLVGVVVFVACVIAFAAGVTWLVVRLSPTRSPARRPTDTA